MSEGEAADFPKLKQEILDCCGLSPTQAAGQFQAWVFNPRMDQLLWVAKHWPQPNARSAIKVVERMAIDTFLRGHSNNVRYTVGMAKVNSPRNLTIA